jgi:hypothetical protein
VAKTRTPDLVVPPAPFFCPAAPDYAGAVFIWDLDKTYLDTHFETLGGLVRTALEKARDKVAFPGVATLIRALRRSPDGVARPTYFVSASPPQLADIVERKLRLDGAEVDGIYFKDNIRNLRPGRLKRLKKQLGYKILALIDLRCRLPVGARETMFGDDAETDPQTYALYASIIEHRLRGRRLVMVLEQHGVPHDEAVRIAWRARALPECPPVERIYIQAHKTRDPNALGAISERIIATQTYFETALALYADHHVGIETLAAIGDEIANDGGGDPTSLAASISDLVRREVVPADVARFAAHRLAGLQILSSPELPNL